MLSRSSLVFTNCLAATVLISSWGVGPALAQQIDGSQEKVVGRVPFDFPEAPPATVEVDLSEGMMLALSGIAQAPLTGVAEGLADSRHGNPAPEIAQSAEHLKAVNQMVTELTGAVHEVRVRVYDNLSDVAPEKRAAMIRHYQDQLRGSSWDSIVRVNDHGSKVNVNVLRSEDAIRGIFVLVSEENELVMANVVCELTSERIKQVAHGATLIGMKFGLEKAIQQAMIEIGRELH